jgi:ABC-type multidrug transport system fused ATPase/permease subunit
MLIVTHKFGWTQQAVDNIVLLDGGAVAATGTHATLMRSSALYKQLWGAVGNAAAS